MALGPGKYDDLAEYCLHKVNARAVVVVVIDGDRGHGISGKQVTHNMIEWEMAIQSGGIIQHKLATVLRHVAKSVEDAPPGAFNVTDA